MADDRTGRTPKKRNWKGAFLEALANSGNVRLSCRAARIGRQTAYDARYKSKVFAERWDRAIEEATDGLEAEAWRRAAKGTQRPVFYKGEQCGAIQEYSDTLLIFLLKANRPEKYRDNFDYEKLAGQLSEHMAQSAAKRARSDGDGTGQGQR